MLLQIDYHGCFSIFDVNGIYIMLGNRLSFLSVRVELIAGATTLCDHHMCDSWRIYTL